MPIEKDIANIIVSMVAVSTVAEYLMPDRVNEDLLKDIGVSKEQYLKLKAYILQPKIASIISKVKEE